MSMLIAVQAATHRILSLGMFSPLDALGTTFSKLIL